jgi:hypothetical protein
MNGFLIFIAVILLLLFIVHGFTLYKSGKELNNSNLTKSGAVCLVIVGISAATCAGVYFKTYMDLQSVEEEVIIALEVGDEDASLELTTLSIENRTNGLKPLQGAEPIHYSDLEKFLPIAIEGYDMEAPEGTTLNMEGFAVSSATAEYTSAHGDYIRVSILDYNAARSVYKMSTAMWGMGITIDSDDEYAKSFSLNNDISGWESFEKINNKSNVVAGIGNRLLITIEANNQSDSEKTKDILALVNLKSMVMFTNKE